MAYTTVCNIASNALGTDSRPFHRYILSNGGTWAEFYRCTDGYLVSFPNLADFWISRDGVDIVAAPRSQVPQDTVDHLYLNQIAPLALSRQLKFVLHGSAVDIGSGAVAFLGQSGHGKSTLATSFATAGCRFISDDALQVDVESDRVSVCPGHPSLRLWDDSREALLPDSVSAVLTPCYSAKGRYQLHDLISYCDTHRPLIHVFILSSEVTSDVQIRSLRRSEAMIALVQHAFLLDVDEREMLTAHFRVLSRVASRTSFSWLSYPRRFECLAGVREAIQNHVGRTVERREV